MILKHFWVISKYKLPLQFFLLWLLVWCMYYNNTLPLLDIFTILSIILFLSKFPLIDPFLPRLSLIHFHSLINLYIAYHFPLFLFSL